MIRAAAADATACLAGPLAVEDAPRIDQDTQGQSGTPAISETIYRKIEKCSVFLADVTLVGKTDPKDGRRSKQLPNPNVLIELGYAAGKLGWDRIVLALNKHYGSPESLPFDLRNRRFPVTFDLGPNSRRGQAVRQSLASELQTAIGACLAAENLRVEDVLSRLSSFARRLMLKHGSERQFWETEADNKVLSRLDLAISQLLDLGIIRCVQAATESSLAYAWTNLGSQCCQRLGIQPTIPEFARNIESPPSIQLDLSSYDFVSTNGTSESRNAPHTTPAPKFEQSEKPRIGKPPTD